MTSSLRVLSLSLVTTLIALSTTQALGQVASGAPDPGRSGGCDPNTMPATPGQKTDTGQHDNPGLGPVDTIPICDVVPDGLSGPDLTAYFGIWYQPPEEPNYPPHPPILCSYGDSSPSCAGSRSAAVVEDENFTAQDIPYQGWGWFQGSRPELVVDDVDTPTRVRIVLGIRKVYDFSVVPDTGGTVFHGVNGLQGVVVRTDGDTDDPELYRFYDTAGKVWTFFGYYLGSGSTWLNPYGANGQLWTAVDADGSGSMLYTGHATNPATALSSGFEQVSSHPTARPKLVYDGTGRKWEYSYTDVASTYPMLTRIKISVLDETWDEVWRVEFAYYESNTSGKGVTGDLKSITETRPLSSGGDEVKQWYFRYFTDSSSPDKRHLIKMRIDPEGVRRTLAASITLDSASDGTLEPYAALVYQYDSNARVSQLTTGSGCGCGGSDGVYTFSRSTPQTVSGGTSRRRRRRPAIGARAAGIGARSSSRRIRSRSRSTTTRWAGYWPRS